MGGWQMGAGSGKDRSCRRLAIVVGDKTLDVRKSNWS